MTSGPMPINALPPEERPDTPTTVDALAALIATYLRSGSDGDIIGLAYDLEDKLGADASDALWREAYAIAARKPLTVAPAGQGAASLYIAPDGHDQLGVWFKRRDGHVMHLLTDPGPDATAAEAAMWEHLAATLPAVAD